MSILVFKIYKVSANYITEATKLHFKFKERGIEFNKKKISEALKTSGVNAQNAINAASQLSLLNTSEKFSKSTKETQKILFRQNLQSFIPFIDFIESLYEGKTPEEAARLVKTLHNWGKREEDIIWIFKNWGTFAGIFQKKKGKFEFRQTIKTPEINDTKEILNELDDELKAKIWIKNRVGNAFNILSNSDYKNLTKSILKIQSEPRESIKNAGEVLEDFLRKIATKRNIDVSNKNGISQISIELRNHKIIASKHVGILKGLQVFLDRRIFDGLSAFRNMSTHGIDKLESKRWELSSELALTYVIQVVLCIKSIFFYCFEQKLTF